MIRCVLISSPLGPTEHRQHTLLSCWTTCQRTSTAFRDIYRGHVHDIRNTRVSRHCNIIARYARQHQESRSTPVRSLNTRFKGHHHSRLAIALHAGSESRRINQEAKVRAVTSFYASPQPNEKQNPHASRRKHETPRR